MVRNAPAMGRLAVCGLLAFAPLAARENTTERVRSLTAQVRRPIETLSAIRQRAAALEELIQTDPAQALANALPEADRARLRAVPGAEAYLESDGEWQGAFETVIEEDFAGGRSITRQLLRTNEGNFNVSFAHQAPPRGCLSSLRVRGMRVGNSVAVRTMAAVPSAGAAACGATTGEQRVAVILLTMPGAPLAANLTPAMAGAAFFGAGRSLDGFWREASYGKTWAAGAVFGPFMLDQTYTCGQYDQIRAAGIRAAQTSVDFTAYTHVFFLYPKNGTCNFAFGTVGCAPAVSSTGAFSSGFVWLPLGSGATQEMVSGMAAHEGGHNLGLGHASSLDFGAVTLGAGSAAGTYAEYGDWYSAMGVTWNSGPTYGYAHYAATHKQQLGWLDGRVQTVDASGAYTVQPYESQAGGVQALRISRGDGTYIWVEYRQPIGNYDPNLRLYSSRSFTGPLIHFEDPSDTAHPLQSKLLSLNPSALPNDFTRAPFSPGATWSDPYSGLSLCLNSATAAGVTVTVTYAGQQPAPDPAPAPAEPVYGLLRSHPFAGPAPVLRPRQGRTGGSSY